MFRRRRAWPRGWLLPIWSGEASTRRHCWRGRGYLPPRSPAASASALLPRSTFSNRRRARRRTTGSGSRWPRVSTCGNWACFTTWLRHLVGWATHCGVLSDTSTPATKRSCCGSTKGPSAASASRILGLRAIWTGIRWSSSRSSSCDCADSSQGKNRAPWGQLRSPSLRRFAAGGTLPWLRGEVRRL